MIPTPLVIILSKIPNFRRFWRSLQAMTQRGVQLENEPEQDRQCSEVEFKTVIEGAYFPLKEINDIQLPNNLNNLGFCFVEASENNTESTYHLCQQMLSGKVHPFHVYDPLSAETRVFFNFRVIIFHRQGESAEAIYKNQAFLFDPRKARVLRQNYESESLEPETIGGFSSDITEDYVSKITTLLFSDLQQRCSSTDEIREVISSYSLQDLHQFLSGGESIHYLEGKNSEANILTTLIDEIRFYNYLADDNRLKFHEWESNVNSPWVYLTVFERDEERFKPLYSLGLEFY